MLLSCPECRSSFRVSAETLGDGRIVRCAHCKYEWFAEARDLKEEESEQDFPESTPAPTSSIADPVFDLGEPVEETERQKIAESLENAEMNFSPERLEDEAAPVGLDEEETGGFEEPPIDLEQLDKLLKETESGSMVMAMDGTMARKKPPYVFVGLLFVIGLLAMVAGYLLVHRDQYLTTPGVSQVLKIANVYPTEGLTFADVRLTKQPVGTKKMRYNIEGKVVNQSDKARAVPIVRLRLMDKTGLLVQEWKFAQPGLLKPGEQKNFKANNLESQDAKGDAAFQLDMADGFDMLLR